MCFVTRIAEPRSPIKGAGEMEGAVPYAPPPSERTWEG